MKKKITILFGEMGTGKTHWGKIIAAEYFLPFFDGDDVVTKEMIERVSKFKPMTKEMIDDYVKNHLAPAILERASEHGLIVAQALYLNEHRLFLKTYLESRGCEVKFYWIRVPWLQNIEQLWFRPKGYRWIFYWLLNKPFFEKPTHQYE